MAQFDVWRNVGPNAGAIPFVVEIQGNAFRDYRRRLVIPLQLAAERGGTDPGWTPAFTIEGREVFLNPPQLQSVPVTVLRERVGSLAGDADAGRIIRAIDEVISRG